MTSVGARASRLLKITSGRDPSASLGQAARAPNDSPLTNGASRRRALMLGATMAILACRAHAQKRVVIPLQWYQLAVEDNAFTVELPGIPEHRVIDDRSARGTAFPLHSYSLELGGYSYVVQTALYPFDVDVTQPRLILQAALADRARKLVGGKWAKVDWREIQGAAAVESTGPLPGGSELRQLMLLKQRRFVSLAFLGPAGTTGGAEASRFVKSLKLP